MKILVTGAGAVLGQAIIKSLKEIKYDHKIEIISCDPNPLAVGLFWTDKKYSVPFANSLNYKNEIYKILELEKPNYLLVGTDVELDFFSKNKKIIANLFGTIVIVSKTEVIEIGDDKWKTFKFLTDHGFYAPNSCLKSDYKTFLKSNKFPLIVKPRVGARSKDVFLVKDLNELEQCLEKVKDPIVQEYLDSNEEFTAGVIYFGDDSIASIVMKRTLKDGNTFVAQPIEYSYINKYLEKITKELDALGPINYQFRLVGGKVKIFEINSRFSGTTHFRTLSNFNEVKMVLDYYSFNTKVKQPLVNSKISILRFYDEIVVNIK
jgi:carbamoyl-phosphate synthase large subunit